MRVGWGVAIGRRVRELRAALEDVTGVPVPLSVSRGPARVRVPAPPASDPVWPALLAVMRRADRWGSGDAVTDEGAELWAEIDGEERDDARSR